MTNTLTGMCVCVFVLYTPDANQGLTDKGLVFRVTQQFNKPERLTTCCTCVTAYVTIK